MANVILSKESSSTELKCYFEAVLKLAQSANEFPINLDEVWMIAYTQKVKAVTSLKRNFIEGIDYNLYQMGKVIKSTEIRNGITVTYMLSVSCLEYFIARKVRPVFEVYRQVFHKALNEEITYTESQVKELKTDATFWKNQAKMLEDRFMREKAHSKALEETKNNEMDLKNSCFYFLIKKKLYDEWHNFNIAQKEEAIYQRLKKEEKERLKKLMPLPF